MTASKPDLHDLDLRRANLQGADMRRAAGLPPADERLRAVLKLLKEHGCDCPCDHHPDERGPDCEVCLPCRIEEVIINPDGPGRHGPAHPQLSRNPPQPQGAPVSHEPIRYPQSPGDEP